MRRDLNEYYKNEKRTLKRRYLDELYGFYDLIGIKRPLDPPKRTVAEEVANAVSHGLGALFSLLALVFMLPRAKTQGALIGCAVYFFGLFIMFMSSCLYHALGHGTRAKRVLRRLDYAGIYLLIGATFFPLLLSLFNSGTAAFLISVQWLLIAAAISLVATFGPGKSQILHAGFCLLLGWSGVLLLPRIIATSKAAALFIIGGGALYTVGVIPCFMKRRGSHFIWHIFVLLGSFVEGLGVLEFL